MSGHIFKCSKCNKYTMKELCCGEKTISSIPPKYSPEDNYAKYRREAKKPKLKKSGML